jgi:hypothetical protein
MASAVGFRFRKLPSSTWEVSPPFMCVIKSVLYVPDLKYKVD